MNALRRLPLSRLLLLLGAIVALGAGGTALADSLSSGPVPGPKPLADAVHDALAAPPVSGVSARIRFTDSMVSGSIVNSAGGDGRTGAQSPLLSGATGRLWAAPGGLVRLELQSDGGDAQIVSDGHTVSFLNGSSNDVMRFTLPSQSPAGDSSARTVPSVASIESSIARVMQHANLSGAEPGDVAHRAAYSVRISPASHGGLVGGAELAWDALTGVPLRLAVFSSTSSAPVLELTATQVSYGRVPASTFTLTPPAGAKVQNISPPTDQGGHSGSRVPSVQGLPAVRAAVPFTVAAPGTLEGRSLSGARELSINGAPAALITYGQGLDGIAVLERAAEAGSAAPRTSSSGSALGDQLPKLSIGGTSATVLPTALGTVVDWQAGGVAYTLAGSVPQDVAEAAARGL